MNDKDKMILLLDLAEIGLLVTSKLKTMTMDMEVGDMVKIVEELREETERINREWDAG